MKIFTKVSALVLTGCLTSVLAQTQTDGIELVEGVNTKYTEQSAYTKQIKNQVMTQTMQRTRTQNMWSAQNGGGQAQAVMAQNMQMRQNFNAGMQSKGFMKR
jgi:preprotein translocase subunit SecF